MLLQSRLLGDKNKTRLFQLHYTLIVLNSAKRVKNKISILLRPYENSKVIDLLFSIEKNSPKLHDSVETFWFCLATFAIYFKR